MKKKLAILISFLTAIFPMTAMAASATMVNLPNYSQWTDINALANNITKLIVLIAALSFFVFFMIGGMQYLFTAGDPNQATKAKNTLIWSTIGFLIIVIGYSLARWLGKFFGYSI